MNLKLKAAAQVSDGRCRIKRYGSSARCDLTVEQWLEKLIASDGICVYCRQDVGLEKITPDHVVPLARGGEHSIENVVPSCLPCNKARNPGNQKGRKPRPRKLTYEERKAIIDQMWREMFQKRG